MTYLLDSDVFIQAKNLHYANTTCPPESPSSSDVFIQAKNLHYGFDFCPAFWDWIDQAHREGLVYSTKLPGKQVEGK